MSQHILQIVLYFRARFTISRRIIICLFTLHKKDILPIPLTTWSCVYAGQIERVRLEHGQCVCEGARLCVRYGESYE